MKQKRIGPQPKWYCRKVYHWKGRRYVIKKTRILIPMIRQLVPAMVAKDLLGVQPMPDDLFLKLHHLFDVRPDRYQYLPKKKRKWIDRKNSNYGYDKQLHKKTH